MKTSFTSTVSVQTSLRQAMAKAQSDLVKANTEVTTGVHADMGVALGGATSRNIDLTRDVQRIEAQQTTNSVAKQRLDSSEESLKRLGDLSQKVLDSLAALTSSTSTLGDARATISNALDAFTDIANTSVTGEYLFSGTNTDVKPLASFSASGSPFKAAVDAELNNYLSTNGIAAAKDMTPTQMQTFLDDLQSKFNGTTPLTDPPHTGLGGQDFWSTFVSDASSTNMTTRISATEVVATSTTANTPGFRNFVFASVVGSQFLSDDMPENVRTVISNSATSAIGKAISGINDQRSDIGLSSQRVKEADDSLAAQKTIIETHLNDLQGVDAYEASTRVTSLQALLEAAYTLTSRIQKLSLVNFL
ncbi:flagellar hook-associated family protein [Rhizobium straminoryzae]|uniref:Flagellin n=1 Tax=Rhizobium straminoryzae TaxID=1387186 RepID=A0A549TIF1_9HYPH|nr:flagellar hook-associated family protein [Rhizobium straminoryzae]TRL43020.1 flagellar hook-associated family protein [Rhizobium straminoryzae]